MALNFYEDNKDIAFHLKNLGIEEIVTLREENWEQKKKFPEAPSDYEEAMKIFETQLEKVGRISAEKIFPRGTQVDRDNVELIDGKVRFAPRTLENLSDLQKAGLMGVTLPREYHGLNYPVTVYSMMTEMVSRADASLQNLFGLQDIAETIYRFGDEDQKARFLPRFASGEADGAMALTEPEAGSDLQSVQTTATYDEATGKWYLNGKKRFITNGCAKVILVLARSEEGSLDGRGLSMFILEKCPQITINSLEDKMGIHGSPTCELIFNNAPCELVGQRRRGLTRYVMSLMNGARLAISSQAVGLAEASFRCAMEYTSERRQFGKALCEIIPVNEMLTRMKAEIMAGRTLLYETCKYVDLRDCYNDRIRRGTAGPDDRKLEKYYGALADALTPMTKYFNTEMCNHVCYQAIQCHGGKGFMRDHLAERYYRDARITNIYEGTSQMQVVAAIAGVKKRALKEITAELAALPFEGELAVWADRIRKAQEEFEEALQTLENNDSVEFFDLMAHRFVRMQTLIFISWLLLRDARIDASRICLVNRFLKEYLPEVSMQKELVLAGMDGIYDADNQLLAL